MKDCVVYIKADRNSKVENKVVRLSDVAKIYSKDQKVVEKIKSLELLRIESDKSKNYIFSILKVIEVIQEVYPEYLISSVGETDFIVEYSQSKKQSKVFEWIKIVLVCLVTFFGAAFTIMSFNEDASVNTVFDKIYEFVLHERDTESYLLEISYAIGLPIGTLVFFNHFSKVKISSDPTPLQIQLRVNEQDINETLIENAEREGNSIDVD